MSETVTNTGADGAAPAAGLDAGSETPVQGLDAVVDAPSGEGSAEGTPAAPDLTDFETAFQADPKRALKVYKDAQRALSERQRELDQLRQLRQLVSTVGTEQRVIDHFNQLQQELQQYRSNPRLAKILDTYKTTGQIPGSEYGDSYAEPEPEDPREVKIRELEQRLAAQDARVNAVSRKQADVRIQQDIERLREQIPEALWPKVSERISQKISEWDASAATRGIVENLTFDTLRLVAADVLWPSDVPLERSPLADLGKAINQRTIEQKRRAATDAAPRSATTGRETSPAAKTALQALQRRKQELGIGDLRALKIS